MAGSNKRKLWIYSLLGLVTAGLLLSIVSSFGTKVVVSAKEVETTAIEAYLDEWGKTSLPELYHITMPMQGRILPMSVDVGQTVQKGQVVAKLDDIRWQEATLEVASITSTFNSWLQASNAQLKAARIKHDFDKWNWERKEKLGAEKAISRMELREAERNYLDSVVQLESSQAMFYATKALESIIDLLPGYVNRNLRRTEIRSPVNGTILRRHVWNEKMMSGGEPILDIGDLSLLEVTAEVLTEEAVWVNEGDPVRIYGGSLGDLVLDGRVRQVEPKAFTKTSSLGVEEQRVSVKIAFTPETKERLEREKVNLGLHYRLRVRIITDRKERALVIPRTALFYGADGGWQLYRVEDSAARLTEVQLGLVNEVQAEVVEGLSDGDMVIDIPQADLADGVEIQLVD